MNVGLFEKIGSPWVVSRSGRKDMIWWISALKENGVQNARLIFLSEECTNLEKFFDEIKIKANLPDYFGFNLNALNDCFNDGDIIDDRALAIVIDSGKKFLIEEPVAVLRGVIDTFQSIGSDWSVGGAWPWNFPPRAFLMIIQVEQELERYEGLPRIEDF